MLWEKMRGALMRNFVAPLVGVLLALPGAASAQGLSLRFDMPAEPLAKALHDYSAISGAQIIFSDADVAGKTAPALKGEYSADKALTLLLSGTDLVADRSARGGIMVRPRRRHGAAQGTVPPVMRTTTQVDDTTSPMELDTVSVTGSRVRRESFYTPVPTTVLTAEDLAISGHANLFDALSDLPSVLGGLSLSTNPASGNYVGATYLSLRGLGAARTLVLVDGQRFTPSSIYGPVSISLVPQALVSRVEIVTGGASAQWGSDAIAGVVNLVLDHDLEGFRGGIQGGSTDHGDNRNHLVSLAFGHRFSDGRARVELAAEAGDNGGVGAMSRDWLRAGWQTIANPGATAAGATAADPPYLTVPGVRTPNASYGGVITSGPLKGIQFGPGGVPGGFSWGDHVSPSAMVGGDGVLRDSMIRVEAPLERQTLHARLSFDFTPRLKAYLQASYGRSRTAGPLTLPGSAPDTSITITSDNAFLPASIRAAMAADQIASFTMGRWSSDYAMSDLHYHTQTLRAGGGIKGDAGGGWTWDVSYFLGGTNSPIVTFNNRNTARYNLAIDAVVNPATGLVVCRSTLTDPGDGCVPMDLLGPRAPSQAALAYVMGTSLKTYDVRRTNGAATLDGAPFSTWAGPVSLATGIEYRRDSVNVSADPVAAAGGWGVSSQVPFRGAVAVWEGFGELVAPLARDTPPAKELNLDVAVRETGYSTSGAITTWKTGLVWAVNDRLRLRANRSHDMRAPALTDLYQGGSSANKALVDRLTNETVYAYAPTTGNPRLRPETADTTTVGLVLRPRFLPDFEASVDYYDIRMRGLIVSVSAQNVIDNCYHYGLACNLITRDAAGTITEVPATETNLQSARNSGVDIEAEHRLHDVSPGWGSPGTLTLHYVGSYVAHNSYSQPGEDTTELAGVLSYSAVTTGLSGGPHWRFSRRSTWDRAPYSVSVTGRYVGGGSVCAPDITLARCSLLIGGVSGRFYTDLYLQYSLADPSLGSPQLFAGVRNAFDREPPITGGTSLGQVPTDPSTYDVIGRQYMAGVRLSF